MRSADFESLATISRIVGRTVGCVPTQDMGVVIPSKSTPSRAIFYWVRCIPGQEPVIVESTQAYIGSTFALVFPACKPGVFCFMRQDAGENGHVWKPYNNGGCYCCIKSIVHQSTET